MNREKIIEITSEIWWIFPLSVLMFIIVVTAVPAAAVRMPSDYFIKKKHSGIPDSFPFPVRFVLLVFKNLLGIVLTLSGFIMLFIPGQGLLTIIAGLMLTNFPGKRRLELYIIRKKTVYRAFNWIRGKAGREPVELP